jgi:hypothetical protein
MLGTLTYTSLYLTGRADPVKQLITSVVWWGSVPYEFTYIYICFPSTISPKLILSCRKIGASAIGSIIRVHDNFLDWAKSGTFQTAASF